jgi:hypothetical protein
VASLAAQRTPFTGRHRGFAAEVRERAGLHRAQLTFWDFIFRGNGTCVGNSSSRVPPLDERAKAAFHPLGVRSRLTVFAGFYGLRTAMAGPVRQPIDLASLERYIEGNVPQIKTPLSLKQVSYAMTSKQSRRHILTRLQVRLWSIESYIPDHRRKRHQICHAKEAAGLTVVEDGA